MKVFVTGVAGLALFAFVVIALAHSLSASIGEQKSQPGQVVRQPNNLSSPVGEEMRVQAEAIDTVLTGDAVILLDVREPWELEELGTREGYINIPLGELENRLDELPQGKMILTA